MKIAKEGFVFILPSLVLAVFMVFIGWWPAAIPFFFLTASFTFFFRDPKRLVPADERLILSPADGKVLGIDRLPSHPDFPSAVTRITIFLSLFNVHLTRAPISAAIRRIEYHPGKFLPAYRKEAGEINESNSLLLEGGSIRLFMKQIVGVAARRIKCFVKADDHVDRGQKIGLMYFGSRVEVYLPLEAGVKAGLGQRLKAGVSVIAEVKP